MTTPTLLGEVVVTPEARIKVRVGRRGGRDLVDLRLFRQGEGVGLFDQATKSGFANSMVATQHPELREQTGTEVDGWRGGRRM